MEDRLAFQFCRSFSQQLLGSLRYTKQSSEHRQRVTATGIADPRGAKRTAASDDNQQDPGRIFALGLRNAFMVMNKGDGIFPCARMPPETSLRHCLSAAVEMLSQESISFYRRIQAENPSPSGSATLSLQTGDVQQDVLRCVVLTLATLFPDYWDILKQRFSLLKPRHPFIRCSGAITSPTAVHQAPVLLELPVRSADMGVKRWSSMLKLPEACGPIQFSLLKPNEGKKRKRDTGKDLSRQNQHRDSATVRLDLQNLQSLLQGLFGLALAAAVVYDLMKPEERRRLPQLCAPPSSVMCASGSASVPVCSGAGPPSREVALERARNLSERLMTAQETMPLAGGGPLLERDEAEPDLLRLLLGATVGQEDPSESKQKTTKKRKTEAKDDQRHDQSATANPSSPSEAKGESPPEEDGTRSVFYGGHSGGTGIDLVAQALLTAHTARQERAMALLVYPSYFFVDQVMTGTMVPSSAIPPFFSPCDVAHMVAASSGSAGPTCPVLQWVDLEDVRRRDNFHFDPRRSVLCGSVSSPAEVWTEHLVLPLPAGLVTGLYLYHRLFVSALWVLLYAEAALPAWIGLGGGTKEECRTPERNIWRAESRSSVAGLLSILSASGDEDSAAAATRQRLPPPWEHAHALVLKIFSPMLISNCVRVLQQAYKFGDLCCPVCDSMEGGEHSSSGAVERRRPVHWAALQESQEVLLQRVREYMASADFPEFPLYRGRCPPSSEDPPSEPNTLMPPATPTSSSHLTSVQRLSAALLRVAFEGISNGVETRSAGLLPSARREQERLETWWGRLRRWVHGLERGLHSSRSLGCHTANDALGNKDGVLTVEEAGQFAECLTYRLQGLLHLISRGSSLEKPTKDDKEERHVKAVLLTLHEALSTLQGLPLSEILQEVLLDGLPLTYVAQWLVTAATGALPQQPNPHDREEQFGLGWIPIPSELEAQRNELRELVSSLIAFPSTRSAEWKKGFHGCFPFLLPSDAFLECSGCFSIFHQRCVAPTQRDLFQSGRDSGSSRFFCHTCRLEGAATAAETVNVTSGLTLGITLRIASAVEEEELSD